MRTNKAARALAVLGLTNLEAMCYVFLLANSPVTAYRVAQALGKTAPSVYKTLEVLEHKGLVIVDDGRRRLYRAVPAEEVLARLEAEFRERQARAAKALDDIHPAQADERVYQLSSYEQVIARARAMLSRAGQRVIIDASAVLLDALETEIEATAERGISVLVKSDRPIEIAGAEVVIDTRGQRARTQWQADWCNLVVDESEHMLARLRHDAREVRQAIWSDSPYLSWIYYCGIRSEILLDRIGNLIKTGAKLDDIRVALVDYTEKGGTCVAGCEVHTEEAESRNRIASGIPRKGRKR